MQRYNVPQETLAGALILLVFVLIALKIISH
jgi:hypothetical protein